MKLRISRFTCAMLTLLSVILVSCQNPIGDGEAQVMYLVDLIVARDTSHVDNLGESGQDEIRDALLYFQELFADDVDVLFYVQEVAGGAITEEDPLTYNLEVRNWRIQNIDPLFTGVYKPILLYATDYDYSVPPGTTVALSSLNSLGSRFANISYFRAKENPNLFLTDKFFGLSIGNIFGGSSANAGATGLMKNPVSSTNTVYSQVNIDLFKAKIEQLKSDNGFFPTIVQYPAEITITNGVAKIRWDFGDRNSTFRIYRSQSWIPATPLGSTELTPYRYGLYFDRELTVGQTYHYRIIETGSDGRPISVSQDLVLRIR